MYDVIIVGAGPAGLTAAIYARRAEKTVLVIEKSTFGGQITHSPRVENYPGFASASGNEIADKMVEQALLQGAEIELSEVTEITSADGGYRVVTTDGDFMARSVIIAAGSKHRMLGLAREESFVGEGVSYCAVCDGAFYKGKTVAVIGGGNTALQEAILLSEGCARVYVVQNLAFMTGERNLLMRLEEKDNVELIYSTVVEELVGEVELRGIKVKNTESGELTQLDVDGVFVAIGQVPENEPFSNAVKLSDYGYIEAGEDCMPKTELKGIFVAGDCRTKSVRQVTTATADGAVAALAACRYIDSL